MQTVTLKIKLLSPNKGKLEKMVRMQDLYRIDRAPGSCSRQKF